METDTQTKPRKWFRRSWFKILTFILITPVWVAIVWLDPDEKKGIKVFAGVVLALGLAVTLIRKFGPEAQARKALQREWDEADHASRIEMLTDRASHSVFDLLGESTREEVIAMLGLPDNTTADQNLVYHIDSTNGTQRTVTCTLRFSDDGKVNGMGTQSRSMPME